MSDFESDGWQPSRWWRVIAPDGSLWCETSDEQEARTKMRAGDTLGRLYARTEYRWVADQFDGSGSPAANAQQGEQFDGSGASGTMEP